MPLRPKVHHVLITLLGVRGSTPAPGADFVRYGGHTSCVAISSGSGADPTLVLDAGTGLRSLPTRLAGRPFHGSILLSHLHWDHMQGIPFFTSGDRADSDVRVYLPAQDGKTGAELLTLSMSPPTFPITPDGLLGRWRFEAIDPGLRHIEGLAVTAAEVRHKGGRTFGYRVSDGVVSMAYLPDHMAAGELSDGLEQLVGGVDVLLHDAQFTEAERTLADSYGHSTIDDAVRLAERLDVGRLVLIHHGPNRTDSQLDQLARSVSSSVPTTFGVEGQDLDITPQE